MLTRRQFSKRLLAGGTALLSAEALPASAPGPAQSSGKKTGGSFDLLIKGGTVVDPGQKLHSRMDVAVKDGKIFQMAPDIQESLADVVYLAKDKIVTPGFIDLHVHCFDGVGSGMNADHYCLARGVTTVVDAGSTGFIMVGAFIKHIVRNSNTRIRALIDIGALGTMTIHECPNYFRDMYIEDFVQPQSVAKAAAEHRPDVVGIKIHLDREVSNHALDYEITLLKKAVEAAELAGLPLMAHAMNTANISSDLLKLMRKGDVFTHCFHGYANGILDANGKILPGVREARERGIHFDIGADRNAVSFDVAEQALQQDFAPDSISSDLTVAAATHSTGDLVNVTSKMMALGMTLEQVIERVTSKPAQTFDFGTQLGALRVGGEADISVFEVRDEKFEFTDNFDYANPKIGKAGVRTGRQKLVNKAAIRQGQLFVNEM
jgi:dihydroorotase